MTILSGAPRPGPTPRKQRWPDYEVPQILTWADAHHGRTGEWPRRDTGLIADAPREKWASVDTALRLGFRGLSRGSSLARLLQEHRGVRNRKGLPPFKEAVILAWADAHHERTGAWPTSDSGPILEAPGETWMAVAMALGKGLRGLPGGSSLALLLLERRHVRNNAHVPLLDEREILRWADAHHQRAGRWPTSDAGPIPEAPGETWNAVDKAFKKGRRGLPGSTSLARFLQKHRGAPNHMDRPPLTEAQILGWADAHYQRMRRWPVSTSGPVVDAPGERWSAISTCLRQGNRTLPGGSSLSRLLAEHRGARRPGKPVRVLPVAQILAWADAYHERTGRWPTRDSGSIAEAPGETWCGVNVALQHGNRGLPRGSSLARLLARHRGRPNRAALPRLTKKTILAWADVYHRRTGKWPHADSGSIPEAPGQTWNGVDKALRNGYRGLPGGSSLLQLLHQGRGVPSPRDRPPLTEAQILAWADAVHERTGEWPTRNSGAIDGAPGESWSSVNTCLIQGNRGLPGGSSLARLLDERRGVPNLKNRPELTARQILAWADAHYARQGHWPRVRSGPIEDAPGETWSGVESALQHGYRGLPGGSSLARLIRKHRKE